MKQEQKNPRSMTERRPLMRAVRWACQSSPQKSLWFQRMSETTADCQIPFITSLHWADQTDKCLPSFRVGPQSSVKYYQHCSSVCDVTTTEMIDFSVHSSEDTLKSRHKASLYHRDIRLCKNNYLFCEILISHALWNVGLLKSIMLIQYWVNSNQS